MLVGRGNGVAAGSVSNIIVWTVDSRRALKFHSRSFGPGQDKIASVFAHSDRAEAGVETLDFDVVDDERIVRVITPVC